MAGVGWAQSLETSAADEVFRYIPLDSHGLDFLSIGWPYAYIGTASQNDRIANSANSRAADLGPVYKVGGGVSAPQIVEQADPIYSQAARKRRIEGIVGLWVVIGADGLPRQITVEKSVGHGLDEAAVEAVQKWRFRPGVKDGKPVAGQIHVEINFKFVRR